MKGRSAPPAENHLVHTKHHITGHCRYSEAYRELCFGEVMVRMGSTGTIGWHFRRFRARAVMLHYSIHNLCTWPVDHEGTARIGLAKKTMPFLLGETIAPSVYHCMV